MKPIITADYAIDILGLPEWYVLNTPAAFWTGEAFALFQAARRAGIIDFDSQFSDTWGRGLGIPPQELKQRRNTDTYSPTYERLITQGQLAYFCQRACKRLHLNQGAHTNWAPFEAMFNYRPKTLRRYLHNVEERHPNGLQADPLIDRFFNDYKPQ